MSIKELADENERLSQEIRAVRAAQQATLSRLRFCELSRRGALDQRDALYDALGTAASRLRILTDRMRACHQKTGAHGLIEEAEAFCDEAAAALEMLPPLKEKR